jgi:hypothetical protein
MLVNCICHLIFTFLSSWQTGKPKEEREVGPGKGSFNRFRELEHGVKIADVAGLTQADICGLAGALLLSVQGMRFLCLVLLVWACANFAHGQTETSYICISCDKRIRGEILMVRSPYHKERQPACHDCAEGQKYCFTCDLPAKKGLDLGDGRVLCRNDAKTAILSGEQAKRLFEEVKRDMILLLRGSKAYPDRNVTFALVDKRELESLSRLKRFPSTHSSLLGITRTREKTDGHEHEISVLAGMPPNKFFGVCAHEYGHAWLHENLASGRTLDADTVEGFCELLAYKYICARADEVEKKLLLENDYTQGQIDAFVKAEAEYNFHLVTKWVIGGEDTILQSTNVARLLLLQSDPEAAAAAFAWPPPTALRVTTPTNLVLKSISGTAKRRFAMINGTTLAANESAKILLASTNLTVRCLQIKDASVIIQVIGEAEPQELFLPTKAN